MAHIPDLNPSDSKAFAEFTRAQGMAYLQAVDDWLEQRRAHRVLPVKRSKKKGVAAGVHLVAFLGDSSEVAIPRLRRPAELREALA